MRRAALGAAVRHHPSGVVVRLGASWSNATSVCFSDPGVSPGRDSDDVDERRGRSCGAATAGSPEPTRSIVEQLRGAYGVISLHRLRQPAVEDRGRGIGVLEHGHAAGTGLAPGKERPQPRSMPPPRNPASQRRRKSARIAVSVLVVSLLSSLILPSPCPLSPCLLVSLSVVSFFRLVIRISSSANRFRVGCDDSLVQRPRLQRAPPRRSLDLDLDARRWAPPAVRGRLRRDAAATAAGNGLPAWDACTTSPSLPTTKLNQFRISGLRRQKCSSGTTNAYEPGKLVGQTSVLRTPPGCGSTPSAS